MAVTPNVVNMPNLVKQSGRRVRTQLGVLHSAESPLKRGYPMSLTQWTIDTAVQASWQEFVGPGVVVQSVHSDHIAWHASVANWISWGTEQTGYAAYNRAQWLTKDGRDQLERLAMQWAGDAKYFGWKLEDLRWLPTSTVRAIVAGNDTTTKGFCTHSQVDPANRSDPGPNYPYDLLLQRVRYHFTVALQSGTVTPIQEDEMPYNDWPQADKDALVKDLWSYKGAEETRDVYWYQRFPGYHVWRELIESSYDEPDADGNRPSYRASTFLATNNKRINSLVLDELPRLLGMLGELADSENATAPELRAQIKAAVEGLQFGLVEQPKPE